MKKIAGVDGFFYLVRARDGGKVLRAVAPLNDGSGEYGEVGEWWDPLMAYRADEEYALLDAGRAEQRLAMARMQGLSGSDFSEAEWKLLRRRIEKEREGRDQRDAAERRQIVEGP